MRSYKFGFANSSIIINVQCFVRFRKQPPAKSVMGPAARCRNEEVPFDSAWLPHKCIVGHNSLEQMRVQRATQRSAASLRGVGATSVAARQALWV